MNTYDTNPWNDGPRHPQVLYPDQLGERVDLCDLLAAEWAQQDRAIAASRHRAGRPSARAVLRRLGYSATIAIAVFNIVYFGGQLLRVFL